MTVDPGDDADALATPSRPGRPQTRFAPAQGAQSGTEAAVPVAVEGGSMPAPARGPEARSGQSRSADPREPAERARGPTPDPSRGRGRAVPTDRPQGRCGADRPWRGRRDVALVATLRTAAPRLGRARRAGAPQGARRLVLADLRERARTTRRHQLLVLVVDVSGSMGAELLALARRAVGELLRTAYRMRDRVGVVALRGRGARVLVPPTRSVVLAERHLADLETGGTTPLAAGLAAGLQMITLAERRDRTVEPVLVVLSDGRANVGARPGHRAVLAELAGVCRTIRARGAIRTLVLDATEDGKDDRDAARLAEMLGARRIGVASLRDLPAAALMRLLAGLSSRAGADPAGVAVR